MQDFAEAPLQPEFLLDDGDEHVNADRDPHLSLHRVVARPVKGFDMQVLFDPFEEQFDLPTLLVKRGNDGGGQCKIVRQKYEPLSSLRIAKANTPQMLRIVPPGIEPVERD